MSKLSYKVTFVTFVRICDIIDLSNDIESEKIFKMRRNEHQELQTLINLKDCVITEIRVDEDCYGPCDTCDQDAKYYKSVSFTTSDFGYLEINLKSIDSDEERLSIADLIRFFAQKIEDFEDMTWVEFESEIKRFHGIDERELM